MENSILKNLGPWMLKSPLTSVLKVSTYAIECYKQSQPPRLLYREVVALWDDCTFVPADWGS